MAVSGCGAKLLVPLFFSGLALHRRVMQNLWIGLPCDSPRCFPVQVFGSKNGGTVTLALVGVISSC